MTITNERVRLDGTSDEKVADLLEQAARVLEKVGWVRGAYTKECAPGVIEGHCAIGSIRAAAGWSILGRLSMEVTSLSNYYRALRALAEEILLHHDGSYYGIRLGGDRPEQTAIIVFNDRIARELQEVLDMMQAAAKRLRTEKE